MPSKRKFRHQDISVPGAGTKVRTIHAGKHELRIAFPKGARKRGSGKLVSILHPKGEKNPECGSSLVLAEVSALEIPLGAASEFGPAFEGVLEPMEASQNPFDWKQKWEALKTKVSGWIASLNPSGRKDVGDARLVTRHGGFFGFGKGKEYWEYEIAGRTYQVKKGKGIKKLPVKPWYIDTATGAVSNPQKPSENFRAKAKKNEFVKDSDGKPWMIQAFESGGAWVAEAYRVTKGKVGKVVATARGDSEASAYDNLLGKIERNPKGRRNLDAIDEAAELAGEFRGEPAGKVIETKMGDKVRDDFAHFGWTDQFVFVAPKYAKALDCRKISDSYHEHYERFAKKSNQTASENAWKEVAKEFGLPLLVFDVTGDKIELVCSVDKEDPKRRQLYFLGKKQAQLANVLDDFQTDVNRDRVDLGPMLSITYEAKKIQLGDDVERPYYHVFGEEGGAPPRAFFDMINKQLMLSGGTYHLNEAERGIIN